MQRELQEGEELLVWNIRKNQIRNFYFLFKNGCYFPPKTFLEKKLENGWQLLERTPAEKILIAVKVPESSRNNAH